MLLRLTVIPSSRRTVEISPLATITFSEFNIAKTAVPANATPNYTGGWSCNLGYHRSGEHNYSWVIGTAAEELLEMLGAVIWFAVILRAGTYDRRTRPRHRGIE
jgi:hypothetical protein